MGSHRSLVCRKLTIPSSARRTGGLLFLAAKLSVAGGSPWFDQLLLDPTWLFQSASDTVAAAPPAPGVQVGSASDLALRSPLKAAWTKTEIVQTFSGTLDAGSMRWSNWATTSLSRSRRSLSTADFDLGGNNSGAGWTAGTRMERAPVMVSVELEGNSDRHGIRGQVRLERGSAWLATDLSRTYRRSDFEISTEQGSLAMDWSDLRDSLAMALRIPLGESQWTTRAWSSTAASSGNHDLVDTGSASGWTSSLSVPSDFGTWMMAFQREHAQLRTVGGRDGRVFHDQDWRTVRVGIDASWRGGAWSVQGTTRQLRLDIPYSGLERPFVHWNMIPEDVFSRVAGVLEDQSEYLDGSFRIQSWNLVVERNISWKNFAVKPGMGISWTGFDALLQKSTLAIRGLFPSVTQTVPCDGTGWVATTDIRMAAEWKTPGLGAFHAGGIWRQPLAGGWNSRASADRDAANSGAGSGSTSRRAIDPLGFHAWSMDWMLAL
jgi:hypothetical protein